jgi:hypothetical protein
MDGLHRRRRLPRTRAVARRRLVDRRSRPVDSAALLAAAPRRVATVHTGRSACGRSRGAGRCTSATSRPTHSPRWAGARLPTEAEWEARGQPPRRDPTKGNFAVEPATAPCTGHVAPRRPLAHGAVRQLYGDVWEWTASAYHAYPGFTPSEGAVGEYNGKFMRRPDGAARRLLYHPGWSRALDVPATSSIRHSDGCSPVCGLRRRR